MIHCVADFSTKITENIELSFSACFFWILQRKFFVGEKLENKSYEVDTKMENCVTMFDIVGTHRSLKVLMMKLLLGDETTGLEKSFYFKV